MNFSSVTAGVAVMLSFKRIYPLACRVPSRNLSHLVRAGSMDYLFDVELADALLHPDVFDGVPNSIGETEFLRYCIDQDKRAGGVGGIDADVFHAENALPKWLARFQILHAVKFERIGYSIENALGNFQSLAGQLVNFVFDLEETGERDESRDDGCSENVWAKVSGGFVAPENREQNNKSTKAKAAEKKDAGIFHLRRRATPDRFFRHA